jgi:hypothetical protein
MKNLLRKGLFILMGIFLAVPALAAPGEGPGDPPGGPDPDPTPIDNWMFILAFSALAVGIYFVVKSKRKSLV